MHRNTFYMYLGTVIIGGCVSISSRGGESVYGVSHDLH